MTSQQKSMKQTIFILLMGLVIVSPLLLMNAISTEQANKEREYQTGVSIGYNPEAGYIYLNYTDKENDTSNLDVKILSSNMDPTTPAFEKSVDRFPATITYVPDDKVATYTVLVRAVRENGNYTNSQTIVPIDEEKRWGMFGKYVGSDSS